MSRECSKRSLGTGDGDEGSSLILALIFLVVVGMVVGALAQLVSNDLRNTSAFTSAQSFQSTANSATQVALQNVRYNFMAQTLNASPPQPCWTPSPTPSLFTLNGQSVDSWCTTQWSVGTTASRVVTISTCLSTLSASGCALGPLLQVIVTFGDFNKTSGESSCAPVTSAVSASTTTCGTTMAIDNWVFGAQPPSVNSLATGSSTCVVGSPVAITGSNLSDATNVSFVLTSGTATNEVFAASSFTVASSTQINACTPSTGSGTAYVVVTTPTGGSLFGPTFTY